MQHGEFRDPRLVEVYDAAYGWSRDDDWFLSIVDRAGPAARVLDLGCGTGRLALGMAAAGHVVTGVDPARASLDAARAKPGAGRVTWIEGTSSALPDGAFDAAVMTSHVAQLLVDDEEWRATLADLARALRPGGVLAFDARDPGDRAWERWNPVDSRRRTVLPGGRAVASWTEVTSVAGGVVGFTHRYEFDDGDEARSEGALRFRTEAELRASLAAAGFTVEDVVGGWAGEPVGAGDGELLVVARR